MKKTTRTYTKAEVIRKTLEVAGYHGLVKYVGVGSDSYSNIIEAVIRGGQLDVTYLDLSGWAKGVSYPINKDIED